MKIDNIIENAVKAVINEYTDSDFSGAELIRDVMANKPDNEAMEFITKYFPTAVKSMSTAQGNLKASDASPIKKRMGQYAPMFIHVQYNKFEDDANQIFAVHQRQYYNSNFKNNPGGEKFNPQVTKLAFMGGDDQKDNMGEILVVTDEYIKDLSKLRSQGKLDKTMSESIKEGSMSDIHMIAQEASTIEEFIKEFMADYGDKFAGASKPKLDKWLADLYTDAKSMKESKLNENRGQDEATDLILKLERNLYTKLSDLELDAFKKEMAQHFGSAMNESTTSSKTESITKRLKEDTEYQEFFKSTMHKFGVKSPKDLKGKKKDEFFNYVDKNYKAKSESTLNEDFFKTYSSASSINRKTTTQLNNTFKDLQSRYKVPARVLEIAVELINELVDQGWEEGRLDVDQPR